MDSLVVASVCLRCALPGLGASTVKATGFGTAFLAPPPRVLAEGESRLRLEALCAKLATGEGAAEGERGG